METSVELYAELLLNIRSLSLSGRIQSRPTDAKEVEVSGEGNIIKVRFNGAEAGIEIPIKIILNELSKIKIAGTGQDEIASRLPLVDGLIEPPKQQNGSDNVVPWTADALSSNVALHCRHCGRVMVKPGKVKTWKDLPSTNWAEMMDFWHCHKPHEQDRHDTTGASELGHNGEQHHLSSARGIGFVDIVSFVFHRDDITQSVNVSHVSQVLHLHLAYIYPFKNFRVFPFFFSFQQTWEVKKEAFSRHLRVSRLSSGVSKVSLSTKLWICLRYSFPRKNRLRDGAWSSFSWIIKPSATPNSPIILSFILGS